MDPSASDEAVAGGDVEVQPDLPTPPAVPEEVKTSTSPLPSPEGNPDFITNPQASSPEDGHTTDAPSAGAIARKFILYLRTFLRQKIFYVHAFRYIVMFCDLPHLKT